MKHLLFAHWQRKYGFMVRKSQASLENVHCRHTTQRFSTALMKRRSALHLHENRNSQPPTYWKALSLLSQRAGRASTMLRVVSIRLSRKIFFCSAVLRLKIDAPAWLWGKNCNHVSLGNAFFRKISSDKSHAARHVDLHDNNPFVKKELKENSVPSVNCAAIIFRLEILSAF